jgi:hypothetical protein
MEDGGRRMGNPRRFLNTLHDLTELLRDLPPEESCVYRGVAFDTYSRGGNRALLFLLGPVYWVIDIFLGVSDQPKPGDYLRVWLPAPLEVDVMLRLLPKARSDGVGLSAYYSISAAAPDRACRFLDGPLTDALLYLAETYDLVEMYTTGGVDRSQYIEFGPLDRRPEETAADLDRLIEALTPPLVPCELVDVSASSGVPSRD